MRNIGYDIRYAEDWKKKLSEEGLSWNNNVTKGTMEHIFEPAQSTESVKCSICSVWLRHPDNYQYTPEIRRDNLSVFLYLWFKAKWLLCDFCIHSKTQVISIMVFLPLD